MDGTIVIRPPAPPSLCRRRRRRRFAPSSSSSSALKTTAPPIVVALLRVFVAVCSVSSIVVVPRARRVKPTPRGKTIVVVFVLFVVLFVVARTRSND